MKEYDSVLLFNLKSYKHDRKFLLMGILHVYLFPVVPERALTVKWIRMLGTLVSPKKSKDTFTLSDIFTIIISLDNSLRRFPSTFNIINSYTCSSYLPSSLSFFISPHENSFRHDVAYL